MIPYCPSEFARYRNPVIDTNTVTREQCNGPIFFGGFIWSQTGKDGKGRHSRIVGRRRYDDLLSMEARADRRSELHQVGMLSPQLPEGTFTTLQVGFENA